MALRQNLVLTRAHSCDLQCHILSRSIYIRECLWPALSVLTLVTAPCSSCADSRPLTALSPILATENTMFTSLHSDRCLRELAGGLTMIAADDLVQSSYSSSAIVASSTKDVSFCLRRTVEYGTDSRLVEFYVERQECLTLREWLWLCSSM